MKKTILALSLGVGATLTMTLPAQSQSNNCAPREAVVGRLSESYGESRQSIGLAAGNRVVEMYASPETGTWTLLMTLPDGLTCILGAGQAFERLDEEVTPAGQPT